MAQLVVGAFVTLDGVMQGPGGPDEDRDGGFEHGGWNVTYWDDAMSGAIVEQSAKGDAILLGRKTYDIWAAHWPNVSGDPISDRLNSIPKYVTSRTMDTAEWKNTTVLKGEAAQTVARLKAELDGRIMVNGSGELLQTLIEHDLIDEYYVWTFPLLLGTGKRLFGSGTVPAALKLTETTTSTTGVTISTYVRSGDIAYGSFQLEQ
ncbi:dihydrofolate reductase family protein [Phytoactinopolyspora limicola]|uniref:dihydrofolate reductase family protein n=1 Tax=Phytoactinopolyspora limicola TaxID=2715536 RepID=UPI00140AEF3C|nr:dihydrofolate reductase family protein [Phytoactinopolyspora limicola]